MVGAENWGLVTYSTAEAVAAAWEKPPVMVGEAEVFVLRLHAITEEFAEVAAVSENVQMHIMAFGMADEAMQDKMRAFGRLYMDGQVSNCRLHFCVTSRVLF